MKNTSRVYRLDCKVIPSSSIFRHTSAVAERERERERERQIGGNTKQPQWIRDCNDLLANANAMMSCNHLQKVGWVCDVGKCLTLRGLNQHSFPVCDVCTHLDKTSVCICCCPLPSGISFPVITWQQIQRKL